MTAYFENNRNRNFVLYFREELIAEEDLQSSWSTYSDYLAYPTPPSRQSKSRDLHVQLTPVLRTTIPSMI
tara:strand:- start:94 stop:303 length:210 start_codon:yes stop_codon:yes gene_type:complete